MDMQQAVQAALADLTKSVGGRVESLEKALQEFQDRSDEVEMKANRAGLGGLFGSAANAGDEQRKALDLGIRALVNGNQAAADQHFAGVKSMMVGSDPDGGYVVTPTFSNDMTKVMLEMAPFIGLARTVELESDVFEEPVDRAECGAEWVAETQSRDVTGTPTLGMFRCPVHEIQCQPQITQKLIDTARIDVVKWLQGKVAEKLAHTETSAFFNGNGVAKPRGFLTLDTAATADDTRAWGTLEHVVTGVAGSLGGTDPLIDLVSRLKPQYRAGAVWMMNRFTAAAVMKMKDGEGRPIWLQGIQAGQPNTLLGFPVVESEQMPDIGVNSLSIAFGNFNKGYTIVRRLGVRFLLDPYTNKPNVKLYTYTRVGGDVNNSEAIKLLKFAA